jgi:HD-GYP domain-containing protein (c-di-GMP phosphodiesterase class II)
MISTNVNIAFKYLEDLIIAQPMELRQHAQKVAGWSAAMAVLYECSQEEVDQIYLGGLLHDIGKQFVSENILNKNGTLIKKELDQIQLHPWHGYVYLTQFLSDSSILNTVLYHHERWNGTGYPFGLKHDGIPLGARICAIADVWDALISERCYRNAWSRKQAMELIGTGAGSLFDPYITLLFLRLIKDEYVMDLPKSGQPVSDGVQRNSQKMSTPLDPYPVRLSKNGSRSTLQPQPWPTLP